MSGLGKGVLGVVGISRNEGGAGTFPDIDPTRLAGPLHIGLIPALTPTHSKAGLPPDKLNPKALAAEQGRGKMRRRDPNDPTWLVQQTCWNCGQTGHLHHKCTAPWAERGTHQTGELDSTNMGFMEPEVHARVFITEVSDGIAKPKETYPSNGLSTLVVPKTSSLPI